MRPPLSAACFTNPQYARNFPVFLNRLGYITIDDIFTADIVPIPGIVLKHFKRLSFLQNCSNNCSYSFL